jgi:hypothetical protein
MSDEIEYAPFVTDETPHCLWDVDIRQRNLEFLDSIAPSYFEHVADLHSQSLDDDEKQCAAAALRLAYLQSLETLFALLCAVVQAPDCVVGWVTRYQNKELESVVNRISGGCGFLIRTKLPDKDVSWNSVAEVIFSYLKTGDESKDTQIKQDFSRLWLRLSYDLTDPKHRYEYNSMKHGLRARAGGFYFAMGLEDTYGVPAPPERMQTIAKSDFGSSFFVIERLHDSRNFAITTQRLNWDPENLCYGLGLISMSIRNVISFFKMFYGVPPNECKYSWCTDEATYDEPWKRKHGSMFAIAWHSQVKESAITPLTKQEILAVYDDDTTKVNNLNRDLAETKDRAGEAGGRM